MLFTRKSEKFKKKGIKIELCKQKFNKYIKNKRSMKEDRWSVMKSFRSYAAVN